MEPGGAYRVVRLAAGDVDAMHGMLDVFSRAFEDPAGYDAHRPGAEYLRNLLASPGFVALAALHGQEVVGALAAYELPKFEQVRSELYLYDLAVDAAHRRRGVATALIRELQAIAHECGAWMTYVQADQGDDAAVALYTKLGVREDVMHFDIPPAARPAPTRR